MRADFAKFMRAYRRPKAPKQISQEAYEFKTDHLRRLVSWNVGLPEALDLHDYAEDISFIEEVQPDLFTYLLPVYLQTWRDDLLREDENLDHGTAVHMFTGALARRQFLNRILKPKQVQAVMVFMRNSILDRIDQESNLDVNYYNCNQANDWLYRLGDFAVLFPDLTSLWRIWWKIETSGQAIAFLQFLSAFMYEDDLNPIYVPWTKKHGGGTPNIGDTSCFVDQPWQAENVAFLKEALTVEYALNALERAVVTLDDKTDSPVPAKMLSDFEIQRPLLESRLLAWTWAL